MDLRELALTTSAVDGHGHSPFLFAAGGDVVMPLDEMLDLNPRADVSSALPENEVRRLAEDPGGWAAHREALDTLRRDHAARQSELGQLRAYRDLYGFTGDDPLGDDLQALKACVRRARGEGLEQNLGAIWKAAGLETVLINAPAPDPALERLGARWVPYIDQFMFVGNNDEFRSRRQQAARCVNRYESALAGTEEAIGPRPSSFDAYLDFVREAVAYFREQGCPGVKLHCGYIRTLLFEDVPRAEAAALFGRDDLTPPEYQRFQDFMARHAMACAADLGLPVQVHAALGGLSAGLMLAHADCTNLQNLMLDPELRRVRFVILHGGYPRWREAGLLAENYANVYVDFSWLPALFRRGLARMLEEWLELVPSSKLLYGSDAYTPELYYAASVNAREVLGRVVGGMAEDGSITQSQGADLIRRLMRENAVRLYGL